MANTLRDAQQNVIVGLGDYTHTAANNSLYRVSVLSREIPTSSLSIVIKQNASTIATSVAPTAAQDHVELQAVLRCTAGDVIHVVLSSSAAIDSELNNVKTRVNIDRLN